MRFSSPRLGESGGGGGNLLSNKGQRFMLLRASVTRVSLQGCARRWEAYSQCAAEGIPQ